MHLAGWAFARATKIEVRLEDETVWLTQRLMAELFQKDVRTINDHISNVYEEGELAPEATIRKYRIVQREGEREVARMVEHYNLDMIISVGYRVKSHMAMQLLTVADLLAGRRIDMPPIRQVGATFKKAPKASRKRAETGELPLDAD